SCPNIAPSGLREPSSRRLLWTFMQPKARAACGRKRARGALRRRPPCQPRPWRKCHSAAGLRAFDVKPPGRQALGPVPAIPLTLILGSTAKTVRHRSEECAILAGGFFGTKTLP